MTTLTYKCTLLTDIVLNAKSATEGGNQTLDFIPGNNFLGITAGLLYSQIDVHTAWLIFHSGKVRFGDAHLLVNGYRSMKAPAAMYYPKLSSAAHECYVYYRLPQPWTENILEKQLKQLRNGFYAFTASGEAIAARAQKTFAVKSAYDRERRCSKEQCMYGYEALCAGAEMAFDIEIDDGLEENVATMINQALIGTKHLGRSRTAQYGLVKIEPCMFAEPCANTDVEDEIVTIYADGRLVFYDEEGLPTFQPTPKQLHLPEGSAIRWDLSQVRTFCYAPWNYKRQAYDPDRCGLEKGSVIVAECPSRADCTRAYVGAYNNEGFGRVIYNPEFLKAGTSGKVILTFKDVLNHTAETTKNMQLPHTPLIETLLARREEEDRECGIYEAVNDFVEQYGARFKGKAFASQWGTIRSMAMAHVNGQELMDALFTAPRGYLVHGTAKDKWAEKGRLKLLKDFCNRLSDELLQSALVNLASEMGKTLKA